MHMKNMFLTGIVSLLILLSITSFSAAVLLENKDSNEEYIIYTPEASRYTYLINKDGDVVNSWESNYMQTMGTYLMKNGNMVRADMPYINPLFFGGGVTGQVEMFSWDGDLLWTFVLSNENYCLHHDIEPLPNGNILMIAWEHKTRAEAINAGRNPNTFSGGFWPLYLLEVEPFTNNIVWEWHAWDHLIQDYDPSKENYGTVGEHPELIDINSGAYHLGIYGDWMHTNSVDYNENTNQIVISSRLLNEIYVIDRETGEIVYRWGNPQNYRAPGNRQLFEQHDARWTDDGNILIFNNGVDRGYSTVDEIVPYGNNNPIWTYDCGGYEWQMSGSQRIPNGNTIVCKGVSGTCQEVTPDSQVIWQYTNPYPSYAMNDFFKFEYYLPEDVILEDLDCTGSLTWSDISPGDTIQGSFKVKNIGLSNSTLDWEITDYPDWGSWTFSQESGTGLRPEDGELEINVSIVTPNQPNTEFSGYVFVYNQNDPDDYDVVPISLKLENSLSKSSSFFVFDTSSQLILNSLQTYPISK